MKTVDIADEIYRELDRPASTSVPAISFWLVSNIGLLNTLLNLNVSITDSEEFLPELGLAEKDIFKQLYFVTFYTRLVTSNLGAAAYDASVLEVTEGNRTVRLVNRNEIAKVYNTQKKDAQTVLDDLVNAYKINHAIPLQVLDGPNYNCVPGPFPLYNSTNYRNNFDLD